MEAAEEVMRTVADAVKGVVRDRHLRVLVTLDVRNAFNSAPWHLIDAAVAGFGLLRYIREFLRSYLEERRILVSTNGVTRVMEMTCGVPQRSVLGPTL